ncbi:MAG: hypothetical protein KAQ96_08410, partial [Thermoplasmata archaeon]|nr:hypothetical protein [Thermoplasmata archaeon]
SHQYYLEFEDKVGSFSATARFGGNTLYLKSSKSAKYTYKVWTILERRDNTQSVIRRDTIQINGKLYEDWGGSRGVEVQREIVTLTINGIFLDMRRTAFDGSVTFSATIDPEIIEGGLVDLVLEFDGTEFYEASFNITQVFIRVNYLVTFTEVNINGNHYDPTNDVVRLGDTVHGRIHVVDDNYENVPLRNVSFWYTGDGSQDRQHLIGVGLTDAQGYYGFSWTFSDKTGGTKTLIARCEDLPGEGFAGFNLTYIVPPPPTDENIIDTNGDHRVEPGSTLELEVAVTSPGGWEMDALTYALVSPPDGMAISSDGKITWKPGEDQLGTHTITIWLFDGD